MTTIMISGSRKDDELMKHFAYSAVDRAKKQGYDVIVGDATGVDSAVWWRCVEVGVPFTVYGVKDTPRNGAPITNYVMCQTESLEGGRSFTARDRMMVDKADVVVVIWNMNSRGSLQVAKYAKEKGKKLRLYARQDGDNRIIDIADRIDEFE